MIRVNTTGIPAGRIILDPCSCELKSRLNMVGLIMTTDTQTVSTETLLQLLADPRRRTILHHLIESGDGAVAVEELTKTIATDGGNAANSHSRNARAGVELHHTHLPKLAEAGFIEYDRQTGTVRYQPADRVEKLLRFVSTQL